MAQQLMRQWLQACDLDANGRVDRSLLDSFVAEYLGKDAPGMASFLDGITDQQSQKCDYHAFLRFIFDTSQEEVGMAMGVGRGDPDPGAYFQRQLEDVRGRLREVESTASQQASAAEWQLDSWLKPTDCFKILTDALKTDVKGDSPDLELTCARALAEKGSQDLVLHLLQKGDIMRKLADDIWTGIRKLAASDAWSDAQYGPEIESKFSVNKDCFTLSFGGLSSADGGFDLGDLGEEAGLFADFVQRVADLNKDVFVPAVKTLKIIGDGLEKGRPRVVKALTERLGDDHVKIRQFAAESLPTFANKGDREVIQALTARLGDGGRDVRVAAAAALAVVAEQGDVEIVQALTENLGNDGFEIRRLTAQTMPTFANRGDRVVIKALIARLGDADSDVRAAAAVALGAVAQQGDSEIIQVLTEFLGDGDQNFRTTAASSLGAITEQGNPEVVRVLVAHLGSANPNFRHGSVMALWAVARRGDSDVAQALAARLADERWMVRQAAATALGAVAMQGDAAAIQALQAVASSDMVEDVRNAAQDAASQLEGGA